jgi:prepilin-type N-terminal cleavage/methylation domain-containing protein
MKLKKKKGFTLIELLIVVAIIAILAAIAIPQFAQYRIRGYNSSALADLRNARTAEEAFFSDWQAYASTSAGGVPNTVGAPYTNTTGQLAIAVNAIAANTPSAATSIQFGMSQNVILSVATSSNGGSFVAMTKNTSGNKCYGMDSDTTAIYWADGPQAASLPTAITAVSGADDINTTTGPAPSCTGAWGKM